MGAKSFVFILLTLACACDKGDDPKAFTSFEGYWTLTTPDALTTLTFRIARDQDGNLVVDRADVLHDGTSYEGQPIDTDLIVISEAEIESMMFRTPQFVIRFEGLAANTAFTEMEIAHSYFTIGGTIRNFPDLKATRP